MKNKEEANVYEIFSSIQGEGLFIGQKQIFLRFSLCNLNCSYCDEIASKENGEIKKLKDVIKEILLLSKKTKIKVISLTGGEPLLYSDFIFKLLKKLPQFDFHLETNGTLFLDLKKILKNKNLKHISMDIKLPTFVGKDLFEEHKKFLLLSKNLSIVKIVLNKNISILEFKKAINLIYKINPNIPVFIQIESKEFFKNKSFNDYEKFYTEALKKLKNVRYSIQMHKIWKIK